MGNLDLTNSVTAAYGTPNLSIAGADTDGITGKETEWQNSKWSEQYGAFVNVAEYQNTLLMKGIWNTGKGWTADTRTATILDNMRGWGKDTFDDIIFNADVMSMAGGDSYTQIIRTEKGSLINMKPLNPGTIKIIVKDDGLIKEYQQISRNDKDKVVRTFKPQEIFHLSFNRMADQIHGISLYEKLKEIILADKKCFDIMQKVAVYQAQPFILWKLKTDDSTTITNFVAKVKASRKLGDDLFVPDDENVAQWEVVQISPSQIILEYWNELRNKFYRAAGLPQIVPGGGEQGTGSESRTIYLAFEQLVAQRQLYLQKQIWAQLALKLKFNPPTTMADLVGSTEQKTNEFSAQSSELNAGAEKQ